MHTTLPTPLFSRSKIAATAVLSLLFAGTALNTWAQGELPSGTVSGSGSGPTYTYSLSFADGASATSPIGSVWYAWTSVTPPFFYLPGTPSSPVVPTGWTATVDGNSIRFSATSSSYDIQAGSSLSGFGYTATFSPATLAATANSGLSVAYSGAIETAPDSSGHMFTVSAVPEPGTLSLLTLGAGFLAVALRRQSR